MENQLKEVLSGDDYHDKFDSALYLKSFVSSPEGNTDIEKDYYSFIFGGVNRIFSEHFKKKATGTRLRYLDFGCGPTIHFEILASRVYDEITFADFSQNNLAQIKLWLDRDDKAHDWSPFFNYASTMEGYISPQQVEDRLRKSFKETLICDVLQKNPLYPETREPFDAILSSLCLEASCKDISIFNQSVQNVASLLKSGGSLILLGVLGETYYDVGDKRFFALELQKSDILQALNKAGFVDIDYHEQGVSQEVSFANVTGYFILSATKR